MTPANSPTVVTAAHPATAPATSAAFPAAATTIRLAGSPVLPMLMLGALATVVAVGTLIVHVSPELVGAWRGEVVPVGGPLVSAVMLGNALALVWDAAAKVTVAGGAVEIAQRRLPGFTRRVCLERAEIAAVDVEQSFKNFVVTVRTREGKIVEVVRTCSRARAQANAQQLATVLNVDILHPEAARVSWG